MHWQAGPTRRIFATSRFARGPHSRRFGPGLAEPRQRRSGVPAWILRKAPGDYRPGSGPGESPTRKAGELREEGAVPGASGAGAGQSTLFRPGPVRRNGFPGPGPAGGSLTGSGASHHVDRPKQAGPAGNADCPTGGRGHGLFVPQSLNNDSDSATYLKGGIDSNGSFCRLLSTRSIWPVAAGPQVQVHLPTFPFTAFDPRPKPAFCPEHGFRPAANSLPLSDLGSRPVASGPLLLVRVFRDLLPSASCPQLPARGSGPAASGSLRPAATDPRFPSRSFHPAASGPQLQAHGLQRSPASGPDAGGPRLQVHHGLKLRPASPGWLLPARVGRPAPIGTNDADLKPGWPRFSGPAAQHGPGPDELRRVSKEPHPRPGPGRPWALRAVHRRRTSEPCPARSGEARGAARRGARGDNLGPNRRGARRRTPPAQRRLEGAVQGSHASSGQTVPLPLLSQACVGESGKGRQVRASENERASTATGRPIASANATAP